MSQTNLAGPPQVTEKLEHRRIRAAEREEEHEEIKLMAFSARMARGRRLLQRIGCQPGETLGRTARAEQREPQEVIEEDPWYFRRPQRAGLRTEEL